MNSGKNNHYFLEVKKAINRIDKLVPKLNESERLTLELLLDEKAMKDLEKSLEDAKRGRIVPLERLKVYSI